MYRAGSGNSGQTTWWASRVISGAEADWEERGLSSWPWPNSQPNCYLPDLALVITDALASSLFSLSVSLFPLPANKLKYIRGGKNKLIWILLLPFPFFFQGQTSFWTLLPPTFLPPACFLLSTLLKWLSLDFSTDLGITKSSVSLFGFILFYSLSMLYLDSSAPSFPMAITKLLKVRFHFSRL